MSDLDHKYEDGVAYTYVGDEWISMDQFMVKKDVIKLIDIVWKLATVCNMKDRSATYEYLMDELQKLREELKK